MAAYVPLALLTLFLCFSTAFFIRARKRKAGPAFERPPAPAHEVEVVPERKIVPEIEAVPEIKLEAVPAKIEPVPVYQLDAIPTKLENAPAYKMEAVPGAGAGMIATRFIPRGSLLVSEPPLFTVRGNLSTSRATAAAIESAVRVLSDAQKQIFFSLHNSQDASMSAAVGIVKTNGHPLGVGSSDCGIFPTCSRFNHSCASNASYTWDGAATQEAVYAGKDIARGEQITVNYLDEQHLNAPRSERRAVLLRDFRFECACTVCRASPAAIAASDRRRAEVARLDAQVAGGTLVLGDPQRCLANCKTMLRLYREEGMNDDSLFRTYNDAFQVCVMNGDMARASAFAALAVACGGAGAPSIALVRPFVKYPERHEYAGMSNRWRTEKKAARGAGHIGFDGWLWKRAGVTI